MMLMDREGYTANTREADILNGTQIQRIGVAGALVSIAMTSTNDCDVEIFFGERPILEKADPNTKPSTDPSANVPNPGPDHPEIPFDLLVEDEPAAPGEYIVINLTGGAAAGTLFYRINVEPMA